MSCPDRTGIVFRVSGLLFELGLQHPGFAAIRRRRDGTLLPARALTAIPRGSSALREQFAALANGYDMQWQIHDAHRKARLLIMVSKQATA